jgi:hypothetical protein
VNNIYFILFSFSIAIFLQFFLQFFFVIGYDIKCEFRINSWGFASGRTSGKQCEVKNLVLTSRNENVTSINGQTEARDRDTKIFEIHGQTVNYFPTGIDKFFPNLEAIAIVNSKLEIIEKSDLKPFRQLKMLYLDSNQIEALENNLFEFNIAIVFLKLDRNNIEYIGENVFQPLKNLTHLNLILNVCISNVAYDIHNIPGLITEVVRHCDCNNPFVVTQSTVQFDDSSTSKMI